MSTPNATSGLAWCWLKTGLHDGMSVLAMLSSVGCVPAVELCCCCCPPAAPNPSEPGWLLPPSPSTKAQERLTSICNSPPLQKSTLALCRKVAHSIAIKDTSRNKCLL
eukprot:11835072-Karenia_brevis.AAC.2